MKEDIWADTQPWGLDDAPRSPLLDAKVMMVDDEPLMTDLIQAYLEDEGYSRFVVANDPRQAMELLRREQPSVLLLDLMMPHISGFDLLEMVRGDRQLRYTPVIVLTAATGADAKLRALQLGVTDFLSKPVNESELVLRLRNTLAFHQYHKRLLNFDRATGLPNQREFDHSIDGIIARRALVGGMVALLCINVPMCRQLRESAGQPAADALAQTVARRLERLARKVLQLQRILGTDRSPLVSRLGTTQFGLVLDGLPDTDAVENLAEQVIALIAESTMVAGHEVAAGAWIGIALCPADGTAGEQLRKGATLAVACAQQQAHPTYLFASAELNARSNERLALGSALRGAAQRDELLLHYQPKVDVANGRIVGAEALVRWQHPEMGLIPPLRFIGLAEELGLIQSIGRWVMQTACRDAAQWHYDGLGELKIAINVAKPQFQIGGLCEALRADMAAAGLPPHLMVIELTESMLMDDVPSSRVQMHALKQLGITLSIDDFGTGYSSLSYLKSFPLDELKIDRTFIMDLPGSESDIAIVRAVIGLGHSLGMTVLAEGIETAAQLDCMRTLGCDLFQGFLFSKPVPAAEFVALVKAQRPA